MHLNPRQSRTLGAASQSFHGGRLLEGAITLKHCRGESVI